MNKPYAGFKMLLILSNADGIILASETSIIKKFLGSLYDNELTDLYIEKEVARLSSLSEDDIELEFFGAMNDFYNLSTPNERLRFVEKVIDLIASDQEIAPGENKFFQRLYNAWMS